MQRQDTIQGGRIELLRRRLINPKTGRQCSREEIAYRMAAAGKRISQQTLANWEAGKCEPQGRNHRALSQVLGCRPEDLLRPLNAAETRKLLGLRGVAVKATAAGAVAK